MATGTKLFVDGGYCFKYWCVDSLKLPLESIGFGLLILISGRIRWRGKMKNMKSQKLKEQTNRNQKCCVITVSTITL